MLRSLLLLAAFSISPSTESDAAVDGTTAVGAVAFDQIKLRMRERWPQVARIDVAELAGRIDGGDAPLIFDVREEAEFAVSHIRGARWAAKIDEALALLEGVPREREIVVYCSIGYRSAELAQRLGDAGFTKVRNLDGSIFEWANSGHAVFREGVRVHEVHPYNWIWGTLLDEEFHAEKR